jgi:bacteriocin-type transport-associated protein
MAEILLRELSNADIDWIIATGQRENIAAGTVLIQPDKNPQMIYLLLDGTLSIIIPKSQPHPTDPAVEMGSDDNCGDREIARLASGEIVGENSLFDTRSLVLVRATEDALVLSIPKQQLSTKLQQDVAFGTHFNRAIALMLSERLRQLLEMPGQIRLTNNQPIREVLFMFGELRDSDMDWLIAVGHIHKLAPGAVLMQAGRPVDALYIVLDGLLSAAVIEGEANPLTLCFECEEKKASLQKEIVRLSRGEMVGTISFLDFRPSLILVTALKESLLLAIPRPQLVAKLQQDMGFASRFYRILAIQIAENLQAAISLMGCGQQLYNREMDMEEAMEYDDELDAESLQQVSQGAARFNWMLKQLAVGNG